MQIFIRLLLQGAQGYNTKDEEGAKDQNSHAMEHDPDQAAR